MTCSWESFRDLTTRDAKLQLFRRCPPESKVNLYLKSSYSTHPPDFEGLLDEIVAAGAEIVPFVVARIERTGQPEEEQFAVPLFLVLSRIQKRGYYNVAKDTELMARLEKAVARMSHPVTRDGGEIGLRALQQQ